MPPLLPSPDLPEAVRLQILARASSTRFLVQRALASFHPSGQGEPDLVGCRRAGTLNGHEEHEQEVRDPLGTQGRVDPVLGQRVTGRDRLRALVGREGRRDQAARSGLRLLARRSVHGGARSYGIPVVAMRTAVAVGVMTREQRDFLRKQIDVRTRERLESARRARAQARTRFEARTVMMPPLGLLRIEERALEAGGLPDR